MSVILPRNIFYIPVSSIPHFPAHLSQQLYLWANVPIYLILWYPWRSFGILDWCSWPQCQSNSCGAGLMLMPTAVFQILVRNLTIWLDFKYTTPTNAAANTFHWIPFAATDRALDTASAERLHIIMIKANTNQSSPQRALFFTNDNKNQEQAIYELERDRKLATSWCSFSCFRTNESDRSILTTT